MTQRERDAFIQLYVTELEKTSDANKRIRGK